MEYAKPIGEMPETNPKKTVEIDTNKVYDIKNIEERKDAIGHSDIVVIKYSADWCGPCKKIAPIYHKLPKNNLFNSDVLFCQEDIDDEIEEYPENILAVPTFHIYKKNSFVTSHKGANMDKLKTIIIDLKKK